MNQTLVLQGFYHFCGLNSGLKVNSRTAACHAAHDRLRLIIMTLMTLTTGLVCVLSQNC